VALQVSEMNSRGRMVRAIEFAGPDRVPVVHVVLPAAARQFGQDLEHLLDDEFPDDIGGWWKGKSSRTGLSRTYAGCWRLFAR